MRATLTTHPLTARVRTKAHIPCKRWHWHHIYPRLSDQKVLLCNNVVVATAGPRNPVHGCQDDRMDMVIRFLLLHVSQDSRMLDILRHDFSVWQLVTDGAIPSAEA
ncbi:hypothetical protein MRX96_043254 [Rhipicephalus microplus]